MDGLHWYTVMPWVLTIIFGTISASLAVRNFNRARQPKISLHGRLVAEAVKRGARIAPTENPNFGYDVHCAGGDIYDFEMALEVQWWVAESEITYLYFRPVLPATTPNPFRHGQAVTVLLSVQDFREFDRARGNKPRRRIDDLDDWQIQVVCLCSGRRIELMRVQRTNLKPVLAPIEDALTAERQRQPYELEYKPDKPQEGDYF